MTGSRDGADDLAQAVCLKAMEKAEQFDPDTHLDRWMMRMTNRLWIDELRKKAVRTGGGISTLEDADLYDEAPDPESQLMGREVLHSIMTLPEAQRSAVSLVYAQGYSYREAAQVLDVPVGTIMSRLAAARKKMAHKFGDQGKNT